jgi:hypothetical protein
MHHARRHVLLAPFVGRAGESEETRFRFRFRASSDALRALAVAPPRKVAASLIRMIVMAAMQVMFVVVVKVK